MSKRTSIRIPDDLHANLVRRAAVERRTVSNLIVALLSQAMVHETAQTSANTSANQKKAGKEKDAF